jgi:hypothetical protein
MAGELSQSDGTRLKDFFFGQGGSGPEVGRTGRALISRQIQQRAGEFAARGVEARLIPAARANGNQVMQTISRLPISIADCFQRLIGIVQQMRNVLAGMLASAVGLGATAIRGALTALDAALERLVLQLTRQVGRLGTAPIVIPMPQFLEQTFGPPPA